MYGTAVFLGQKSNKYIGLVKSFVQTSDVLVYNETKDAPSIILKLCFF